MGTLHLVRHGQASFGADDYDQLSDMGQLQSTLLGQWMHRTRQSVHTVVIGPARRHQQTAVACLAAAQLSQLPLQTDAGFGEFNHEEVLVRYEPQWADRARFRQQLAASDNPRKTFQHLFAKAVARWTGGEFDSEYTESWPAFRNRCMQAALRLTQTRSQDIWVFTSAGAISAIVQATTGIPDERIFDVNWTLLNTGVTQLLYQPDRISLRVLNSPAHLQIQDRADLFTYR